MEPILHHYPASPFAEKIRLMLGFKGLAWKSVTIPVVMPKPDLVALTGGYRRTPVLQLGADIYCDTALIPRVLERIAPSPTLYPYGESIAVEAIQHFADSVLFNIAVPLAFQGGGLREFFPDATTEFFERFRGDRGAMRKGGMVRRGPAAECRANFAHVAARIETQLHGAQTFLLGNSPCVADFAVYHTLWPLARVPDTRSLLAPFAKIGRWMGRMQAIGHGRFNALSSAQAISAAKASEAQALAPQAVETDGIAPGDTAEVLPVDYARDAVRGELVSCTSDEIVLRRIDPRAGTLQVHFPRFGFELRRPA
ncbi:MAG: glutathione S-transferase family protein [Burkholderiales bacterium]